MTEARFDEAAHRWDIRTDRGDTVSARHCVMATGCLSTARVPDFEGLASFKGKTYHTGHWPHEGVDFTGQRVGIIGTGSSAIQAIPVIAGTGRASDRVPAHAELQHPVAQRADAGGLRAAWKDSYPAASRPRRGTRATASSTDPNDQSALEVSDAERQRDLRGSGGKPAAPPSWPRSTT